jgi:nickel-dependent lactate racemase
MPKGQPTMKARGYVIIVEIIARFHGSQGFQNCKIDNRLDA